MEKNLKRNFSHSYSPRRGKFKGKTLRGLGGFGNPQHLKYDTEMLCTELLLTVDLFHNHYVTLRIIKDTYECQNERHN